MVQVFSEIIVFYAKKTSNGRTSEFLKPC